jgi:glycosyltransferase involved in cell wall biosynthesis
MPRILRIINRFNLGGPSYNVAYLTKYLAPEYETLLIGGDKEPGEDSSLFIFREMGLEPQVLPEMSRNVNPLGDYKAYRRIRQIIEEFRPDIVHTHAAKAGALGRLAAHHCKVPVIVHTFHGHVFHSYFGRAKTALYKNVERWLARRSSAIIAISEKQKQELCLEHRIVSSEKTHVIPLGFDLGRFTEDQEARRRQFREKYRIAPDELCVTIIGRLAPVKNHPLFLRAISHLKKHAGKKVRAMIVGDGTLRGELESLCDALGLTHSYWPEKGVPADVTFTSWITDVSYPLAGSDVVCLTSFNEGTPVSLIEAQAAGIPIVTTCVGGIENAVSPAGALLVPANDENAFLGQLLLLVNNDDKRRQLSGPARSFVVERFGYQRLVNDTRVLYQRLLAINQ